MISRIVQDYPRLYVLSDEVYKHLTYSVEKPHIFFASLDGMYDRTVTVSSAGKTFALTGSKIGWDIARRAAIQDTDIVLKATVLYFQ